MQRKALITGASSGIGRDLARLFAADKWDVALVARTEPKLRELAAGRVRHAVEGTEPQTGGPRDEGGAVIRMFQPDSTKLSDAFK